MKTFILCLTNLLLFAFFTMAQLHNETKPMYSDTLFYENWSGGNFTTNQWTLPTCDTIAHIASWSITTVFGNPSPSANFHEAATVNCLLPLTSKEINGTNNYTELRYDIYLCDSSNSNVQFAVDLYVGNVWLVMDSFDGNGGSFPWTTRVVNISDYCQNNFYFRFRPIGDFINDNHLNIDNIIIGSFFLGITEHRNADFIIKPNPATNEITIETSTTPAISQVSIMNLNGQEVLTSQITEPKTVIDISNLPSGVYFVRLTNDKTVEVGKIIKN
jgi:hypothetical protein